MAPLSLHASLHRYITRGETDSGFDFSRRSGGITSSVSREAAIGAIGVDMDIILYAF